MSNSGMQVALSIGAAQVRSRTMIIFAVCAALIGCDQSQSAWSRDKEITRVEIYYRTFDSLSPISHSKADLVRAAPFKMNIREGRLIHDLLKIFPQKCDRLQDMSEEKIDYYLLVKLFAEEQLDGEFGSSGLTFIDSKRFPGNVCQLSEHDREALDSWLQAQKQN